MGDPVPGPVVTRVEGYDIYMQHTEVGGGEWLGFRLAYMQTQRGGRVAGLTSEPHRLWRPWHLDPSKPEDPNAGHWGFYRWEIYLQMLPRMTLKTGKYPADCSTRTPAEMRAEIGEYRARGPVNFEDIDGVQREVRIMGWEEWCVEDVDQPHPAGGWVVRIEMCMTS